MEERALPTMLTIEELSEMTGFSKYYIRKLCIAKKIVHVYTGRRYLINYDKFIDFLNAGDERGEDDDCYY